MKVWQLWLLVWLLGRLLANESPLGRYATMTGVALLLDGVAPRREAVSHLIRNDGLWSGEPTPTRAFARGDDMPEYAEWSTGGI